MSTNHARMTPMSLRLPQDLLEDIDALLAYADARPNLRILYAPLHAQTRSGAIRHILRAGLDAINKKLARNP